MKFIKIFFFTFFVIFFAFAVLVYVFFELFPLCNNKLISERKLENGEQLVVYSRSCGATEGDILHFSVIGAGDSLEDEPGNVAIIDGNVSDVIINKNTIEIHTTKEGRIHKAEKNRYGYGINIVVD